MNLVQMCEILKGHEIDPAQRFAYIPPPVGPMTRQYTEIGLYFRDPATDMVFDLKNTSDHSRYCTALHNLPMDAFERLQKDLGDLKLKTDEVAVAYRNLLRSNKNHVKYLGLKEKFGV